MSYEKDIINLVELSTKQFDRENIIAVSNDHGEDCIKVITDVLDQLYLRINRMELGHTFNLLHERIDLLQKWKINKFYKS